MDPRRCSARRHAWRHLAFRPGSDVALLNALIHVIIQERLHNEAYIERFTEDSTAWSRSTFSSR
ncbi:MAG: molybdopterin-dependent oxidoreductase [Isosphaeraceae bacterium]